MKRKIVILVSILFVIYSFMGITYAEENDENTNYTEEYLEYLKLSDEEKSKVEVIPRKYFVSFDEFFNKKETVLEGVDEEDTQSDSTNDQKTVKATSLPSKFSLANSIGISIENQQQSGWCALYTSIKSLETFCTLNGKGNFNFAEYHVAYMKMKQFGGWTSFSADSGLTLGQTVYKAGSSFGDFATYCGFYDKDNKYGSASMYYLMGPIEGTDSENRSYEINETNRQIFTSKVPKLKVMQIATFPGMYKRYDSSGHLESIRNWGTTALTSAQIKQERDAIKRHIYENGSLYALTKIDDEYYNSSTYSLYINDPSVKVDHAVSIIGWDDNYSRYNFKEGKRPAHDGAYIVQNSWGRSWGDLGRYYVSYDDALIERELDGIVAVKDYSTSPIVTVSQANYSKDDKSTKVYLISDEPIYKLPSGWSIYSREDTNKKTIYVKTYTQNETQTLNLKGLQGDRRKSTQVTVKVDNIPELKLDKTGYTFSNQNPITLKPTSNYRFGDVTWKSSNENVARVNSEGIVTPVGNGTCTITASTVVSSGKIAKGTQISATCKINVKRATGVSLNKTSYVFTDGTELQLTATVMPTDLANKDVTWTSSNTNIARVTSNGKVRPGSTNGSCTITATTTDGTNKKATCNVVVRRATYMNLNKLQYTFYSQNPLKLSVTISPVGASKDVRWSSSDSRIATVDENGNVKPRRVGTCTIWATHKDKGYNVACKITVDKSFRKYPKGDITRDGKVDMEDVYTAMKRLARGTLSAEDKEIVEVTDDEKVDMEDIYKILKYVARKITML